ncbi:unnamed protein product [Eruca vesicaria subsp. sativa]|uniref:Uncharacterized protein n=1 Tax=Eruca vesicaria subsp. sativa TaxID=29727 RepID=A0ABC8KSF1_ERUVS|nr:unnamed protein product [Eruca vesicaria subsp. sativa]
MVLLDTPRDLYAKRDLLHRGLFFWNSFTLDRIRDAVELHRSCGILRPLHLSDADEPRSKAVPAQRERVRPQKDKGIAFRSVSEDPPIPGWETGIGREVVAEGSRLINEVAERDHAQTESHSRALVCAERRVRRKAATELARRAALFNNEFQGLKEAHEDMGDFRECRGSVASLLKSQDADFSFLPEIAIMSGLMDGGVHAESRVPPIEGRIR